MATNYQSIIDKRKRDWNCSDLMKGHKAARGAKIPFSSPLLNYATYGGIPRNMITEFYGDPGGGKAQPIYEKVLTPDGYKLIKDVCVGDTLYDCKGEECKVIGVFPQGVRKIYRIHTKFREYIHVADDHLNYIYTVDDRNGGEYYQVVDTNTLINMFNMGYKLYLENPPVIGDGDKKAEQIIKRYGKHAGGKDGLNLIDLTGMEIGEIFHIMNLGGYCIENWWPFFPYYDSSARRQIVEIEEYGTCEAVCLAVDSETHTYLSSNLIPTHNTSTAVDICKNASKLFKQEFDAHADELRAKVSKGDKRASIELEDLLDLGPKKILYLDLEHTFDSIWGETLGITDDVMDVMQPPNIVAEEVLQTVQELIESDELGLVVIDSIPSLTTRAELDKKYGERTVASLAGLLTIFTRKVVPLLTRYNTTLLVINQTRDNMDNPYVVQTPGGKAIKFYAALRMLFRIGSPIDFLGNVLPASSENPAGHIINAKITKQKSAPWDRKNGTYYLLAQSGIRVDMDFAQLAITKYGIIQKSGGWYTLSDPETGEILEHDDGRPMKVNGMANVLQYLENSPEYYGKLKTYILDQIEKGV